MLAMTPLQKDVKKYIDGLNSAPNGWGQHIIDGKQSHFFLMAIQRKWGESAVNAELDAQFAALKAEKGQG